MGSTKCALVVCFINTLTYPRLRIGFFCGMVLGQRPLPCREEARMKFLYPRPRNASFGNETQSIRCHIFRSCAPRWSCLLPRASAMMRLPLRRTQCLAQNEEQRVHSMTLD